MADEEYITVEDAAEILRLSVRMVNRYGNGPNPRLRTRRAGTRVLYHRGDVDALANDMNARFKPRPRQPKAELLPPGEVLAYIRERDQQLADAQNQLTRAMHEIGRLQGMLEQRLLPDDERNLRQALATVEQQRDELRQALEQAQLELKQAQSPKRRWWKFWK